MARYIDAEKLAEYITENYCKKCGIYNGEICCSCPMNDALNYIDYFPTEDVVPKSEVAREIFDEIERIGGVGNGAFLYNSEISKLKNKYTGESHD